MYKVALSGHREARKIAQALEAKGIPFKLTEEPSIGGGISAAALGPLGGAVDAEMFGIEVNDPDSSKLDEIVEIVRRDKSRSVQDFVLILGALCIVNTIILFVSLSAGPYSSSFLKSYSIIGSIVNSIVLFFVVCRMSKANR